VLDVVVSCIVVFCIVFVLLMCVMYVTFTFVVFVVPDCIVYVLDVVVSYIVVFLYCVCAFNVCNVCYLSVLLSYYCHRAKTQLQFNKYIYISLQGFKRKSKINYQEENSTWKCGRVGKPVCFKVRTAFAGLYTYFTIMDSCRYVFLAPKLFK
jgi:hypothetical protein